VLGVVIDAPPMNLIGPELVRDLVTLAGELESDQGTRVMVLESADPEYFVPHVDLTKVAEYTAEVAKPGGPEDASLGMLWHSSVNCRSSRSRSSAAGPAARAANWPWRATCGLPRGRTPSWGSPRSVSGHPRRLAAAPAIAVPTITLEGDANGAPHADAARPGGSIRRR
jgi:hypothetical protein